MSTLRSKLTYANVAASLALFLALAGGSAIASGTIRITSSRQIKDGVITASDIKRHALSADRLSSRATAALRGQTGPAGPQGPPGQNAPGRRWALVDRDGAILAQSGGIAWDGNGGAAGSSYLNFGSPQTGKPIAVTAARTALDTDTTSSRTFQTMVCGATGGGACDQHNDPNHVWVQTQASGRPAPRSYYITVG